MVVAFAFVKLLGADVIGDAGAKKKKVKGRSEARSAARREGRHAMSTEAPSARRGPPGGAEARGTAQGQARPASGDRAETVAMYVGIGVIIIYCLAPFYWMIVSSLRRTADIFDKSALPRPPSLQNYSDVFEPVNNFGRALLNSIIVAGVTTVLVLLIGTFAAYALARLDFRGKNLALASSSRRRCSPASRWSCRC